MSNVFVNQGSAPVTPAVVAPAPQSTPEWMEVGNGLYIQKFGNIWSKIHEHHLKPVRFNLLSSSDLETFYHKTFGSSAATLHAHWA